jgi:hypothetical protein
MPLDYTKHPTKSSGLAIRPLAMGGGGAGQIPASRPRSRPGKRRGTTVGSPRAWGWLELGRRTRRRGRAAGTDGGGRGGSAPAMAWARPGQQVARDGSIGSKEGIGTVA